MDIVDKTVSLLENANIVDDTERYNDAVELICSNCNSITEFYFVNIEPYIDFYQEDFLYEDEVECPICKSKDLNLYRLDFGHKSPDGRKFDLIKKGELDDERK